MNLLICINFILIVLSVRSEVALHHSSPDEDDLLLESVGEKIKNIFRKQSKINVLVSDRESLITSLRQLLPQHSFVTFGFSKTSNEYEKWIQTCQSYCYNSTMRIFYNERSFRRYFKSTANKVAAALPLNNETALVKSLLSDFDVNLLRLCDKLDLWFTYALSGFVLVTSIEEFELRACCLTNRRGIFLFIVEPSRGDESDREVNLERILSTLRFLWSVVPNLKIFILYERQIYIFNPFVDVDAERRFQGKLELCSDDDCSYVSLRRFHRYPLKVEVFESVYSERHSDADPAESIDGLIGPDVKVAYFIQSQMNVTSEMV